MKALLIIFVLLMPVALRSQHFAESQSVTLKASVSSTILAHGDINNDGLLDVIMFNTDVAGNQFIQFIKNDGTDNFILLQDDLTIPIEGFSSYSIVDYDGDNDIDVVLYNAITFVYLNAGNFSFTKKEVDLPAFTVTKWVDLDNNGSREIVGSFTEGGESLTFIYEQGSDGTWHQKIHPIELSLEALEIVDANLDGYKDLFVSGHHSTDTDSLFSGFLLNEKDFQFSPFMKNSWFGKAASGDLNGDGVFDIAFIGQNTASESVHKIFLSKNDSYAIRDSVFAINAGSLYIADLNADGVADISMVGQAGGADTVRSILFASGQTETKIVHALHSQQLLDFNRDGNLDLVVATRPDSIHVTFYVNQSLENKGPVRPAYAMGSKIFDRYFFFWAPSVDDHTVQKSLTYDFFLTGNDMMQSVEFDFVTERRWVTAHGNVLTQNFKLFDELPSDPLGFGIQAIDNSLQAWFEPGGNGICMGTVGSTCPLLVSEATILKVCPFETVSISAPPNSIWFSFKNGYMGTYGQLSYTASSSDTLFYYDPAVFDCTALKAFIIKIRDTDSIEHRSKYACEDQQIELTVEPGWQTVQWRSRLEGILGQGNTIHYTVTAPDSIFARLTGNGCTVMRKTAIKISEPLIVVEHDHYVIMEGSSVTFGASGSSRYNWSPSTNLSDPSIANPVASPTETMSYTVTGYDSINCTGNASVTVSVEKAGFVPNLFTPNDDGKNDVLKIYGLREVDTFSFTIYNREGKLVYESKSPSEVSSQGWDGKKNGTKQPAGVYYWKVKGQHPSGDRVKLNGKNEGSIILVR